MKEYRITESCGCMSVDEMNETYNEEWSHCPWCGKAIVCASIDYPQDIYVANQLQLKEAV